MRPVASDLVLVARDLERHHGAQVVLGGVSVTVNPGARLGVVGPNGIGKSTLLRVLAGLEEPDGGSVARSPATTTVGYLPQEPDADPGETLRAYLARRTGVAAASSALDAAMHALGDDAESIVAYSEALEHYLALGGDDLDARTGAVLAEVGLPADRLDVAVGHLSGGQAARAALAAILLSKQDVLLLDEPTNDLDFAGLDQLERFVDGDAGGRRRGVARPHVPRPHRRRGSSSCACPTTTRVEHAGGWTDFVESRELARRQQQEGYEKYVAERDRLQAAAADAARVGRRRGEERQGEEDRQRQVPPAPEVAALREDGREGQGHREGHRTAGRRRQAVGAVAAPARAEGRPPAAATWSPGSIGR